MMNVQPVILTDGRVRLEPLGLHHVDALKAAAADGELWKIRVTSVPDPEDTRGYVERALQGQREGHRMPFAVFVLTAFFRSLPASLHEAALIDGAGEFGAFWHVMLPLARPGLVTVGIFLFLGNWNEFFVAFVTLSGKDSEAIRTLPLGLANVTIVSQYRSDWGLAFAGLVLMMLPVLIAYIFLQKQLTKGITAGAVKG